MMIDARRLSPIAVLLSSPSLAVAGIAGDSFQVVASVVASCTISGTTLNFSSSIDPLGTTAPIDATSTLTLTCSNTTPYTVALSAGSNAGGGSNFAARTMKSGSRTLAYQLYKDAGRVTVWGDGTAGSSTVTGTGTGGAQTLNIYGRLLSLANAVPGTYTDTVAVSISY
ncbi:spore coat U domain-containing protein [Pelomonas sp. KK5]|uniref:Csu type fimbrial protein n=1 Tax=Pelomonas sp. KK5 TaxID=1855730 RepID=UPI00097BEDDC|nr:spore coat U domain-containing protein [Pelomonas sp. KK5]